MLWIHGRYRSLPGDATAASVVPIGPALAGAHTRQPLRSAQLAAWESLREAVRPHLHELALSERGEDQRISDKGSSRSCLARLW